MTEFIYLIYKHTSPSGKSYIGLTKDYDGRCKQHQAEYSPCIAFLAAIKKYGWDNFIHEILVENVTLDAANILETQFIFEHQSLFPGGYNLKSGGSSCNFSAASKSKKSEAMKRFYALHPEALERKSASMTGRTHSDETKAKLRGRTMSQEHRDIISTYMTNRVVSEETKRKISNTKTGKVVGPPSDETRKKMSDSKKGKPGHAQSEQTKLIISSKLLGIKRSDETKHKLSIIKKGLRKGHKWFYDPNTGRSRTYADGEVPLGWISGRGIKNF